MAAATEQPTLERLSQRTLPDALKTLQESSVKLAKLATDARDMNEREPDKKKALEDTKKFAFQALASVAYQINIMAQNVNTLIDLQLGELEGHLADVRAISQQISASHEFVGRQAIGDMTTQPAKPEVARVVKLAEPNLYVTEDRSNQRIDLYALDGIGLGRTDGRQAPASALPPAPGQQMRPSPVAQVAEEESRGRTNTGSSSVLAFKNRLAQKPAAAVGTPPMPSAMLPPPPQMSFYSDAPLPPPPPAPPAASGQGDEQLPSVQAMYDYTAQTDEEISIAAGDILLVTNPDLGDGWMEGKTSTGKKGIFPISYVTYM